MELMKLWMLVMHLICTTAVDEANTLGDLEKKEKSAAEAESRANTVDINNLMPKVEAKSYDGGTFDFDSIFQPKKPTKVRPVTKERTFGAPPKAQLSMEELFQLAANRLERKNEGNTKDKESIKDEEGVKDKVTSTKETLYRSSSEKILQEFGSSLYKLVVNMHQSMANVSRKMDETMARVAVVEAAQIARSLSGLDSGGTSTNTDTYQQYKQWLTSTNTNTYQTYPQWLQNQQNQNLLSQTRYALNDGAFTNNNILTNSLNSIGGSNINNINNDNNVNNIGNVVNAIGGSSVRCPNPGCTSCDDYYRLGDRDHGIRNLIVSLTQQRQALCYFFGDGGYTVIFQNFRGLKNSFNEYWQTFKEGAGTLCDNCVFNMGIEMVHQMTKTGTWKLKIVGQLRNKEWVVAEYDEFWIDSESQRYKMHLGSYHGTMTDVFNCSFEIPANVNSLRQSGVPIPALLFGSLLQSARITRSVIKFDASLNNTVLQSKDKMISGNNCPDKRKTAWWYTGPLKPRLDTFFELINIPFLTIPQLNSRVLTNFNPTFCTMADFTAVNPYYYKCTGNVLHFRQDGVRPVLLESIRMMIKKTGDVTSH